MTISTAALLTIPDTPDDNPALIPVGELRVLGRMVLDEMGDVSHELDLDEAVALRQAQWIATHALRGWISGWGAAWRALAIELVEDDLSPSALERVSAQLRELKGEVDGSEDPHLDELFADRTLELVSFFKRHRLFEKRSVTGRSAD